MTDIHSTPSSSGNSDPITIASFGDEWERYDQQTLSEKEHLEYFSRYFDIFPWDHLPKQAEGFDMGCGSGRWARLVAPRVGILHCIEPSKAFEIAAKNLADMPNATVHHACLETCAIKAQSQDFGYALGVLHHIPDTLEALRQCARLLKPGAPFLLYLYYRFDNRPAWYRILWKCSERLRDVISAMPERYKSICTDTLAALIYWPLARASLLGEKLGLPMRQMPLYGYRRASFYTMRTDSRDRFGTPLEKRFTKQQVETMMRNSGLSSITFSDKEPYWVAVGFKSHEAC